MRSSQPRVRSPRSAGLRGAMLATGAPDASVRFAKARRFERVPASSSPGRNRFPLLPDLG